MNTKAVGITKKPGKPVKHRLSRLQTGVDGNRNNALKQGEYDVFQEGGAKCGALPDDSELQRIVELWSGLPAATRQAIRMVAEASHSTADTR